MSEVISHQFIHRPIFNVENVVGLSIRNKSPQNEKQALIKKIEALNHFNNQLQMKEQDLQNTIYDLRKLIESMKKQSEESMQFLHSQIQKLSEKKQSTGAALKYVQRDGNHLQRCMLFWKEFQ